MHVLDRLASIFIDVFGITQPTEKTRRRASWFIAAMLVLALCFVALLGVVFYQALHHGSHS